MAGELVSFGIQKLWDLLSQEYVQFKGVEDQVTELKTDLNTLKSFLKDAYAKKHKNTMVRNCVEVIKEIICDAEDILETIILKDQLKRNGDIKKRLGRFACSFANHRKIASDMGGISKRISKVIFDMQSFGVVQHMLVDGTEYSHSFQERLREKRQQFPGECENDLVGLEANVEQLVGYLVEKDNIQVVSVTGMGGLGKTTLARQVFNHDKVRSEFDRLAWVCLTQKFNRKNVWQTILKNFKTKEEEDKIMQMEEYTLQVQLYQLLETSKSLIVIDDIWEQENWLQIKQIFPTKKGWKVLLTSRNNGVAGYRDTFITFQLQCLNNEESWTLFQKITFRGKEASKLEIDKEMENMGKKMLKSCGGLPLAVRVLGGLLAAKFTPHDWKRLSDNIGSHIVEGRTNSNEYNNTALNLGFTELPSYLKYCFLYLAHFLEDCEIDVEKLSYYWAAEGILEPKSYDGESIRDVGESYIEELVKRNMVISKRDITTMRFETCHLHDMMREICLFKAKEENFLHIVGIRSWTVHSQSSTTSRRFVSQMPTTLHVERDINNLKVRSLMVVLDNIGRRHWNLSSFICRKLQLLRVLHIPYVIFEGEKLPSSIGELVHLRYLNLEFARVNHIPSSLGNLKLLIYLNIDIYLEAFVPNVLMGMKDLRYLALPSKVHKKTKLELSNLVDLETLINFSTDNISLEDLHGMVRLRTLGIRLTGERSLEALSASIDGLRHLENINIQYCGDKSMEVDGTVLDFINLKQLKLEISCLLSGELHFPSRLTSLSLNWCSLKEDPMPILEKLLHLKEVYLGSQSFSRKRMVCSAGGFPRLQKLELWGLTELEEWIVEEDSMPLLRTLIITKCEKLKEIPDGLRFITFLKHLNVNSMGEKWKERLLEGGEDYYKVQHISSVEIRVQG